MRAVRLASAILLVAGLAAAATACGRAAPAPVTVTEEIAPEPGQVPASHRILIVALGDSLTAGLGLLSEEAYPARLEQMFHDEGYYEVELINAGVSGDTTAGGLRRAEGTIEPGVRIAIVALGGNDALRGLSVAQTRQNLTGIIDTYLGAGIDVLLVGMEAPTNLGLDYRDSFRRVFSDLAFEYGDRIRFVPFLLEGVAGRPDLNQPDGIHPNAEGALRIAELLYPTLRDMVDDLPPPPGQ